MERKILEGKYDQFGKGFKGDILLEVTGDRLKVTKMKHGSNADEQTEYALADLQISIDDHEPSILNILNGRYEVAKVHAEGVEDFFHTLRTPRMEKGVTNDLTGFRRFLALRLPQSAIWSHPVYLQKENFFLCLSYKPDTIRTLKWYLCQYQPHINSFARLEEAALVEQHFSNEVAEYTKKHQTSGSI